jgi:hypothetical protein
VFSILDNIQRDSIEILGMNAGDRLFLLWPSAVRRKRRAGVTKKQLDDPSGASEEK